MIDIYKMSSVEELENLAERLTEPEVVSGASEVTPEITLDAEEPEEVQEVSKPIHEGPSISAKPVSAGPDSVDRSMVELPLSIFAINDTGKKWPSSRCYPRAYWVKDGQRMVGTPLTTDQRINFDVDRGEFVTFLILMPRLPMNTRPDALRVVILENGVGEHVVCDITFR